MEANAAITFEPEILFGVEVPNEEDHNGVDVYATADPNIVKPPKDPMSLTGNTDPSKTEKVKIENEEKLGNNILAY